MECETVALNLGSSIMLVIAHVQPLGHRTQQIMKFRIVSSIGILVIKQVAPNAYVWLPNLLMVCNNLLKVLQQ
jgi:hypothetical protein